MTTKQYLNQIHRIDKMINNKLSEIYQLKNLVCSISISDNSERVQTSSDKDSLGNAVSKIVDLEREVNDCIDKFSEKRRNIITKIDSIDNDMYYQVLFSRYIEQKTFEKIAEDNEYSVRQILRIHGDALSEFERLYGSEYANMSLNVTIHE